VRRAVWERAMKSHVGGFPILPGSYAEAQSLALGPCLSHAPRYACAWPHALTSRLDLGLAS